MDTSTFIVWVRELVEKEEKTDGPPSPHVVRVGVLLCEGVYPPPTVRGYTSLLL
jgi:hypothetical protein